MSQAHENDIAMHVNALVDAIKQLDDLTIYRDDYKLIQRDEQVLGDAYAELGRLLTKLRFPILRSA